MGASHSKDYIAATYEETTVLVRRIESIHYASLLSILHEHFPAVPTESMIIRTDELDICKGRFIDIPKGLWAEVSEDISNIEVISRPVPALPAYIEQRWTQYDIHS